MTAGGTGRYEGLRDLPELVEKAVALARRLGFALSCIPEQGRLLHLLARGREGGVIGETGTGCGVGLAWMASAVTASTALWSVERDERLAKAAAELFRGLPHVTVLHGDWSRLRDRAPYDLLVLDGGGKRGEDKIDPERWLRPAGALVLDDFTPMTSWPPQHAGDIDRDRVHWLEHPALLATEVRLAPDLATLVAVRR